MLPREPETFPPTFPTRRTYRWVTLAASLFVLYVSVVPFDFRFVPWRDAWASFRASVLTLTTPPMSRSNFLANILLFVPIGFFGLGALRVDRSLSPASAAAVVPVLAWAVAVSLGAEFLQVFQPNRVPAAADVCAQMVGAAIGIGGWLLLGQPLTRWLRAMSTRSRDDRLARVLGAYVIVWIFIQLAPFDVMLDLSVIARRLRSLLAEPVSWRASGVVPARAIWNAVATVLAAIPIGAACLLAGTGRGQRRSAVSAIVFGSAIVTLIEATQFLLISHAPSINDLLSGCAGIAIGVMAGVKALARGRIQAPSLTSGVARMALVFWTLFIVAYHWQPYDFTLSSDLVQRKLASMSLIPLAGYYSGSELNALSDLLLKVWLSVPLGGAAAWAMFRHASARVAYSTWFVLATCLFSGIEAGQLFLPSRFPDPSDVLIGVVSSSLGVWLARWTTVDGGGWS